MLKMLVKDWKPLASHAFLNFRLDQHRRRASHHRYQGSAVEILESLQVDLWNGSFIQGSTGHFRQLWVRDLGLFHKAYERTDQTQKLEQSFEFALKCFEKHKRITTTIDRHSRAYDIFEAPADALSLILWSIQELKLEQLFQKHSVFLLDQSKIFLHENMETDLSPKTTKDPAGMKDAVNRKGSLYTFFMAWNIVRFCNRRGLDIHWPDWTDTRWTSKLEKLYWNPRESFFYDDLSCVSNRLSADANLIGHWLELLPLDRHWEEITQAFGREKMLTDFGLKTTNHRFPEFEKKISKFFAPNYQGDSIWMNLSMVYLGMLEKAESPELEKFLETQSQHVENYGNFLEMFHPNGKEFKTWSYVYDEGMNWSVQLLATLKT